MRSFAELLTSRLAELGMTQVALASILSETKGIPTTKQAVNGWCTGDTRPETWKRTAIYDVLAVPLADRAAWTDALLAKREEVAHPSPLSEELTVPDFPTPLP